ncbi:MAG TPA: hypothetical protein VD905_07380 [Flavobacteriales bacterium]|nr:hypothetical protein [Flavobacteriales bacterium]
MRSTYYKTLLLSAGIFMTCCTNTLLKAQENSLTIAPKINLGYFFPTQTTCLSGQNFLASYNMTPLSFNQVILQSGKIKTVVLQHGGYGFELFYNRKKSLVEHNWSLGTSFFVQKHLYSLDVPDFDFKGSRCSAIIDYYRYFAYKLCLRKYWTSANDRDMFIQVAAVYSNNFKVNDNTWQTPESISNIDYTDVGNGYFVSNYDILKDNWLGELEVGAKFRDIDMTWSIGLTVPVNQYIFKSDITYYENYMPIGTVQTRESQVGAWLNLAFPIELRAWTKKPKKPKEPKVVEPLVKPDIVVNERKSSVQHTYTTKSESIIIEIFDNASADGDTASLYFNGEWLLENYPVNKEPKQLTLDLKPGANDLLLYAVSLGITPPNTAAIRIIDGDREKMFVLNSDYNRCGSLRFYRE